MFDTTLANSWRKADEERMEIEERNRRAAEYSASCKGVAIEDIEGLILVLTIIGTWAYIFAHMV